jgi:ubiquinone/menaquinone biosynthesis C-methylase UbiE
MMAFYFAIRDKFKNPLNKIKKANIKSGDYVLDYGCGPGSYALIAAEVVGPTGKIFAADIHPLAIKKVKKKASRKGLKNLETILTNCNTGLDNNNINVVLCFDTLHALGNLKEHIEEFYRVLMPNGVLSVDDHHFEEHEIISKIQDSGMFKLIEKKEKILNFVKQKPLKIGAKV